MDKVQEYLQNLTKIEKKNSPDIFFYQGDFSLLENERRVSIVGSRKITDSGIKRTRKITKLLIKNNITIVSGLAEGVDTIAHTTAINEDGKTIAVIGTSLDKYYPKENKSLQEKIALEHLIISQFPSGYPTTPKNFPIRNRMMALISDATIIIEASEKSGTKHQGWEALRLGRGLFIMENVVKSNLSWVNDMLEYGAQILTSENCQYLIDDIPYLTSKTNYAF